MGKQRKGSELWVEGTHDKHVVIALLKQHNLLSREQKEPKTFDIDPKNGIGDILKELRIVVKKQDEEGIKRIGIIVDADKDLDKRWRELREILVRFGGYTDVPETPHSNGTVIEQEGRPMIGIWIMPDNRVPGNLETFVTSLVPEGDVLWQHAHDVLRQLPERRFEDKDEGKAHMHTWLAWQERPGLPMGWAITARYLDADAPHAHTLVAWLSRLFAFDVPESCNKG